MTLLAYRYALDPTPAQERALRSHAGAARVAFNWGLARVKAVMDQRAAEATYGITGTDLTPPISWFAVQPAQGLERRQGHRGPMVAGVFQGGVQHWPGHSRPRAEELG